MPQCEGQDSELHNESVSSKSLTA